MVVFFVFSNCWYTMHACTLPEFYDCKYNFESQLRSEALEVLYRRNTGLKSVIHLMEKSGHKINLGYISSRDPKHTDSRSISWAEFTKGSWDLR